jgi:hypothetical protein
MMPINPHLKTPPSPPKRNLGDVFLLIKIAAARAAIIRDIDFQIIQTNAALRIGQFGKEATDLLDSVFPSRSIPTVIRHVPKLLADFEVVWITHWTLLVFLA